MRAADLMPQLMELVAAEPDAVVAVFDGRLAAKPKSCAENCVSWQDALVEDFAAHLQACSRFSCRSRFHAHRQGTLCSTCSHSRPCHGEAAR